MGSHSTGVFNVLTKLPNCSPGCTVLHPSLPPSSAAARALGAPGAVRALALLGRSGPGRRLSLHFLGG